MDGADIRFGVVGLGMGKAHCRAIKAATGCVLGAICDIDPERLAPLADEYGVTAYDSYDSLLRDDSLQVICVATPSGMHVDMAIQALDAGKHILVEKPVGIRADDIRRLVARVRETGLKAASVFQSRTDPLNKRIRQAVQDGRFGKLIGVHACLPWYRKQSYFEGPHGSWKGTWNMDGGGSLMNQGIHTIDLLQWIAGSVERVFGSFGVFAHAIEAEDKTVAVLEYSNGALGTLTTTTAAYGGVLNRSLLFHGERGTVYVADGLRGWKFMDDETGEEEKQMLAFYGAKELKGDVPTVATDPLSVGTTGHTRHVEDLAEAIRTGREPEIPVASAMHSVEIANAIYASGRCGLPVAVSTGEPLIP